MFFAYVFIALGLAILLNTLGVLNATFWGFFWALFFLVTGIKMMAGKNRCPNCKWYHMEKKMHDKIHKKFQSQTADEDPK